MNIKKLRSVVASSLIHGVKINDNSDFFCESCQYGKAHCLKFNKINAQPRKWKTGEFIHTDLCGPFSESSIGGALFYLLFIDEATDYRTVYFIKHKSDVFEKLKEYERKIRNKYGYSIKALRADNGGEYVNESVKSYLNKFGITMENTAPYTPEQNGKAERENRTIVECARTMLHAKNLPKKLWAEAVNTAVYILNRTSVKAGKDITPYEAWHQRKPELSHTRIFGSDAYVHINKQFRRKLDKKAKKLILVGYQAESQNYRLWDSTTDKIVISRDVVFNESDGQAKKENSKPVTQAWPVWNETDAEEINNNVAEDEEEVVAIDSSEESEVEVESARHTHLEGAHTTPNRQLRNRASIHPPKRYELNYAQYNIPETFQEAVNGNNSGKWKRAGSSQAKQNLDACAQRRICIRALGARAQGPHKIRAPTNTLPTIKK